MYLLYFRGDKKFNNYCNRNWARARARASMYYCHGIFKKKKKKVMVDFYKNLLLCMTTTSLSLVNCYSNVQIQCYI